MAEVAEPVTVGRLEGDSLDAALPALHALLASAKLPEDSAHGLLNGERLVPLPEEAAIRVWLVFNVVNALRSGPKIETAMRRAAELSDDDVVFWLRKIISDDSSSESHRRALLIVLTD